MGPRGCGIIFVYLGTPFEFLAQRLSERPSRWRIDLLKERISKLEFYMKHYTTKVNEKNLLGYLAHANGSDPIRLVVFADKHESAQHAFTTILHEVRITSMILSTSSIKFDSVKEFTGVKLIFMYV